MTDFPIRDDYLTKLSRDNCLAVLVDFLDGFMPGLRTIDEKPYHANVTAFAKLTRIFGLPTIVLGDEGGFRGDFFPTIREEVPDAQFIERRAPSAWNEAAFRDALETAGRSKILMGGISIDNCTLQTGLDVMKAGYQLYVLVDCSGTDTPLVEQAAMMRRQQAGAVMCTWVSGASELMGDWETEEGPKVGELYQQYSAWGGQ